MMLVQRKAEEEEEVVIGQRAPCRAMPDESCGRLDTPRLPCLEPTFSRRVMVLCATEASVDKYATLSYMETLQERLGFLEEARAPPPSGGRHS